MRSSKRREEHGKPKNLREDRVRQGGQWCLEWRLNGWPAHTLQFHLLENDDINLNLLTRFCGLTDDNVVILVLYFADSNFWVCIAERPHCD